MKTQQREWMDSPNFVISTSYGQAEVTLTNGTHAYVDANSDGRALEMRGKRYPMTFHFGLYPDLPSFQLYRESQAVYGDAPPSFKAKLTESVMVALNTHLRANPQLLVEAEKVSINNRLYHLEQDQAKLVKELAEVTAQIMAVETNEVHTVWRVNQRYYWNQDDARLAAKGQGEWGSDEYVNSILVVMMEDGSIRILGSKIEVYQSCDAEERARALKKLTPYERKVLGLKDA